MKTKQLHHILNKRESGLLLPVFSLPGPYGIGDLGNGAHDFVDFLVRSGQSSWQILPLGPTSPIFGNSPYMSFSAFAGNPLFISPDLLLQDGLIDISDLKGANFSEYLVAYKQAASWKKGLLRKAWLRFQTNSAVEKLDDFSLHHPWVDNHALFLALKTKFSQKAWHEWPEPIRFRDSSSLRHAGDELKSNIDYERFLQYLFFNQWEKLRAAANSKGIRIIGDLPIYVSEDSVDVWANQEIFALDHSTGRPTHIAGVPPDYFSSTGQRWGNPLYRWHSGDDTVNKQLLFWWAGRLQTIFSQVDCIRIDHFRGFEAFWSVPVEEKTAMNGTWKPGPGKQFFLEMEQRLGPLPIIAEDLGIITPDVEQLRDDLGYPGMKILLFAFDGHPDNTYLPHNHITNCVIYTGTHDNDTAVGWYLSPNVSAESRQLAKQYANQGNDNASSFHRDMIYLAQASNANLCMLPLQDVLGFGNDCRINTPGTTHGNWQWRCAARFLNSETADWLHTQTKLFDRIPHHEPNETPHEHPDL